MSVDSQALVGSYASITGSHGHCGVWNKVINLIAAKRINPLPMITKVIDLDEAQDYLIRLRTDKTEGKIIIRGGK